MISAAEMSVHVASTRQFIEADVEEVVFSHAGTRVRTAAGGFEDLAVSDSPTQRVRMIPQSDKVPEAADSSGTRERPEYIVVGLPDADFRKGDTFLWKGQHWRIAQLHDKPEYIRKGDVVLHRG